MSWSGRTAAALAVLALLFAGLQAVAPAHAQLTSGSFGVSVTNPSGSSSYLIQYEYPDTVVSGQNFTIQVTLFVNQLSGLKLFVSAYNISALIATGTGFAGTGSVGYWPPSTFLGASGNLYPGSHWGPRNLTLTVTAASTSGSSSVSGDVSIGLVTKVSTYEAVGAPAVLESGSKVLGSITIVPAAQGTALPWYTLVVIGAVALGLVAVGYLAYSRSRKDRLTIRS